MGKHTNGLKAECLFLSLSTEYSTSSSSENSDKGNGCLLLTVFVSGVQVGGHMTDDRRVCGSAGKDTTHGHTLSAGYDSEFNARRCPHEITLTFLPLFFTSHTFLKALLKAKGL